MAGELNPKQELFCREYLVDFNATQAAVRAGYGVKNAGAQGFENLKKPEIQARIARLVEERFAAADLSAEKVIAELCAIGFSDIGELFDANGALLSADQMPAAARRFVSSIEVVELKGNPDDEPQYVKKVRLWDKPKALEMLGKYLKILTENHILTGPNGGPIQTQNHSIPLSELTDDELADIERIQTAAAARRNRG